MGSALTARGLGRPLRRAFFTFERVINNVDEVLCWLRAPTNEVHRHTTVECVINWSSTVSNINSPIHHNMSNVHRVAERWPFISFVAYTYSQWSNGRHTLSTVYMDGTYWRFLHTRTRTFTADVWPVPRTYGSCVGSTGRKTHISADDGRGSASHQWQIQGLYMWGQAFLLSFPPPVFPHPSSFPTAFFNTQWLFDCYTCDMFQKITAVLAPAYS